MKQELTFWRWLKQQNDGGMVGDLARDAIQDAKDLRADGAEVGQTPEWWRQRLNRLGACGGAHRALEKAEAEYMEQKTQ
jgi:hypothetical protein